MEARWITLSLLLLVHGVLLEDVEILCPSCDSVTGGIIKVKDGSDATIQFRIKEFENGGDAFLKFRLYFNNIPLLTAVRFPNRKITEEAVMIASDSRFTNASLTADGSEFSVLQLTIRQMTMVEDNESMLKYEVDYTKKYSGNATLIVQGGPNHCGSMLKNNYNIEPGVNDFINFTLCGNPKPKVNVKIGEKSYLVKSFDTKIKFMYLYSVSMSTITLQECGLFLNGNADGYSSKPLSTYIHVLTTPPRVNNIYALLHHNACMTVTWTRIPAGKCAVTYEVQRMLNNTIVSLPTLTAAALQICNATINTTVNVRGIVNGRKGDYNVEMVKPNYTPPPKPTPETTTAVVVVDPTADPSRQDDGMQWKYILAIVVGVIALVLITAVIVIAVRRKDKTGSNNNEYSQVEMLRPKQEMESDYADINTLAPLQRPPINKSLDDSQMVYAELGPGGGRIGPKHDVPEESNYAQVRTEGVHYPDLQQSSYRDQPPAYTVGTRLKNTAAASPNIPPDKQQDEFEDDFEEDDDIIV